MELGNYERAILAAGLLVMVGAVALACDRVVNVSTQLSRPAANRPAGTEAIVDCRQPDGTYRTQLKAESPSETNSTTHSVSQSSSSALPQYFNIALYSFMPDDQQAISELKGC